MSSTIHESPEITVWYHPADGIVHHQIHTYCRGDALRTALLKGLEALRRHGASKWLSDNRKNGALPAEDEEWSREVWSPQARAAGWKYWALVQPVLIVGKMNMARFVKMFEDLGVTVKVFTELEPAHAWLKQMPARERGPAR